MQIDGSPSPQLACTRIANGGSHIFLDIRSGTSLSTEERGQIRLLNDGELSDGAIGKSKHLTAHDERQICKQGSNGCLSLKQIRAELKLPVSNSTVWKAPQRKENAVREITKKVPRLTCL
ncbi:hypothetical protein ANCDUO_09391 [Ancylostoma duodenale]|uniref:Transposable element Tc3 transposase-like DNA-binding HTH domain-containing protein n=1 Tax=Ancylostoma duodenale TaxID=51022 RepID=A0A0C2DD87_9BILA|nr:hypothetical protein ANCDUO_09391 [Ancylostoma duodenale]